LVDKKSGHCNNKAGLRKYVEGIETLSGFLGADIWEESAFENRSDYQSTKVQEK